MVLIGRSGKFTRDPAFFTRICPHPDPPTALFEDREAVSPSNTRDDGVFSSGAGSDV